MKYSGGLCLLFDRFLFLSCKFFNNVFSSLCPHSCASDSEENPFMRFETIVFFDVTFRIISAAQQVSSCLTRNSYFLPFAIFNFLRKMGDQFVGFAATAIWMVYRAAIRKTCALYAGDYRRDRTVIFSGVIIYISISSLAINYS